MSTSTSYELYPLEKYDSLTTMMFAIPPGLGDYIKFGVNSNGETIFQYINPDEQIYGRKYNRLPPDKYGYSGYDWDNPLINPATGTTDWPLTLSDGTPLTRKLEFSRMGDMLEISPDGKSLKSTVPAGSRTVSGYGNGDGWTLSGSGLN